MDDHIFTFGSDHHPIPNAYVRVMGADDREARAIMAALYGPKWAFQYGRDEAHTQDMLTRWDTVCVRTVAVSTEVR